MRYLVAILVALTLLVSVQRASAAPTLEQQLYYAAMQQPRAWYEPGSEADGARETQAEYEHRIGLMVKALAEVTVRVREDGTARTMPALWKWGRKAIAAAVLTHWYEESRFALEVHAGTKHPVWTQDVGRATCLGQLHVGLVSANDWAKLAGTDFGATKLCARWSARALTRMALYCGGKRTKFQDIALPMFSGLGGGGCAVTLSARNKVARFAKIWKAMEQAPTPANDDGAREPQGAFLRTFVPNRLACYHLVGPSLLPSWAA